MRIPHHPSSSSRPSSSSSPTRTTREQSTATAVGNESELDSPAQTRLQNVMRQVGIGVASASFWRGSWYIMDDNLFPHDPLLSGAACLLLGSLGIFACHGQLLEQGEEGPEHQEQLRGDEKEEVAENIEVRTIRGAESSHSMEATPQDSSFSEIPFGSNNDSGRDDLEGSKPILSHGFLGGRVAMEQQHQHAPLASVRRLHTVAPEVLSPLGPVVRTSLWTEWMSSLQWLQSRCHSVSRFFALYALATSCVLVWRGTWVLSDVAYEKTMARLSTSTSPHTRDVAAPKATDPGHSTVSGMVSHGVAAAGLLLTGMFASVLAPPASHCIIRDATLRTTTAQSLLTRNGLSQVLGQKQQTLLASTTRRFASQVAQPPTPPQPLPPPPVLPTRTSPLFVSPTAAAKATTTTTSSSLSSPWSKRSYGTCASSSPYYSPSMAKNDMIIPSLLLQPSGFSSQSLASMV